LYFQQLESGDNFHHCSTPSVSPSTRIHYRDQDTLQRSGYITTISGYITTRSGYITVIRIHYNKKRIHCKDQDTLQTSGYITEIRIHFRDQDAL